MAVDVAFPQLFDLVGIAAGAMEGALYGATRPGVSVVGIAAFAFVAAFGGSMVRDALIGQGPAAVLSNPMLTSWLVAVLLAGLVLRLRWRLGQMLVIVDALYLPIWVVLGADKAIHHGLGALSTVLLGVMTGLGGGLLRDVLAREVPQILRSGAGYGLAAAGSAVLFLVLHQHGGTSREVDALITVAVAFTFRMLCLRWGWLTGPDPESAQPLGIRH